MIVYVLTADVYEESFGSQIILCGTYKTYEKAEETAKRLGVRYYRISETILDNETIKYLGGYNE